MGSTVLAVTRRLYDHSSRPLDYGSLDEAVRSAIERHARQRLLGELAPVTCVETHSVNLEPRGLGFFGRLAGRRKETEHRTVAILLPHALIASTSGAERGITVMSTLLTDISAIDQQSSAQIVDSGIMVESRWGGPDTGSYYIALGDDPAGRAFHEALRAAVVALRQRSSAARPGDGDAAGQHVRPVRDPDAGV